MGEKFLTFGMQYLMMAPFLGFMVCRMVIQINYRFVVLKMSLIFGGLMVMVSVHMTIAMIISGALTEVVLYSLKRKKFKAVIAGMLFACFAVTMALVIAKIMIGGIFESISWPWILVVVMISMLIGLIGSLLGRVVSREMKKSSYE